jgi:hypothetical protein
VTVVTVVATVMTTEVTVVTVVTVLVKIDEDQPLKKSPASGWIGNRRECRSGGFFSLQHFANERWEQMWSAV